MNNIRTKGFICGALAAASYGMNPLFALPLYQAGIGTDSVLFLRYFFAIMMLGIMMKVKGETFSIARRDILPLFSLGILFSCSSLLLFLSYSYMDAGIASTILFVYPVMVAVIMAIFFHERLGILTIFAITMAITGISLLYKGGNGESLSLIGIALVIFSSLTYAIYMVWVNRLHLQPMSTIKLTFYVLLFGILIYVVRLRFGMDLQIPQTTFLWANACSLAIFPTVISLLLLTMSIHSIGSTPTAILGALEPVTALFFGVMVFGERLTPRLLTGITLILIAVTLIVIAKPLSEQFKKHRLAPRHIIRSKWRKLPHGK